MTTRCIVRVMRMVCCLCNRGELVCTGCVMTTRCIVRVMRMVCCLCDDN